MSNQKYSICLSVYIYRDFKFMEHHLVSSSLMHGKKNDLISKPFGILLGLMRANQSPDEIKSKELHQPHFLKQKKGKATSRWVELRACISPLWVLDPIHIK